MIRVLPRSQILAAVVGILALAGTAIGAQPPRHARADCIKVSTKASLLHLGSLDSFDVTEMGTKAAKLILDCVEGHHPDAARAAWGIYERTIPNENFGGEYTALQWMCEVLTASPKEKERMLSDRYVDSFYRFFADNDFAVLRQYIRRKYHLDKTPLREQDEAARLFRFQEDFILFNNPRRERWEKSSKMIEVLNLKKGDYVADIGCGPGYFTFKFSEIVGDTGRVFAADNNDRHNEYLTGLIDKFKIKNIQVVEASLENIGVPKGVKVDCAFLCSLYHIIYSTFTEEERESFVGSIRRCLKDDGSLVIVDNAMVEDQTLPYHGPHIAKELIVAQLKHYGFHLAATHQFIPQRYVLIFKPGSGPAPRGEAAEPCDGKDCVPVTSSISLVQCLKTATSPGFTIPGRKAAKIFHQALDKNDKEAAREAIARYRELIPKERFGDEYTAFVWFCEYILASPAEKKKAIEDKFTAEYFQYLGGDSFSLLKKYVWYKYFLDAKDEDVELGPGGDRKRKHEGDEKTSPSGKSNRPPAKPSPSPSGEKSTKPGEKSEQSEVTVDQITAWGDFVCFNNPRRETWEKTSKMLEFLRLKPGDCVADVGVGPGYYTFKFSEMVGPKGRVYAIDTSREMLDYVGGVAKRHGMSNIQLIAVEANDTKLPANSVDVVYICSLYHAIYVTSLEYVKDQFIDSIKKSLKKGGRLVIADNQVMRQSQVPYYGPRISRDLIILQMKHYGFRLVDTAQFIPQRYMLVFEVEEPKEKAAPPERRD